MASRDADGRELRPLSNGRGSRHVATITPPPSGRVSGSSLVRQAKPAIARLENEGRSSPAATASAPRRGACSSTRNDDDSPTPTVASPPPTPPVVTVASASAKPTAATRHTPRGAEGDPPDRPPRRRSHCHRARSGSRNIAAIKSTIRIACLSICGTTSVAESVDASQTFEDELVKAVRLGPRPGGTTRVVVDLGRSAHYSVFALYNPYRIIVDLNRAAVPAVPGTANAQPKADKVVRASEMVVPNVEPMAITGSPVVERVEVSSDDDVKPAPQVDAAAPGATLSPVAATRRTQRQERKKRRFVRDLAVETTGTRADGRADGRPGPTFGESRGTFFALTATGPRRVADRDRSRPRRTRSRRAKPRVERG